MFITSLPIIFTYTTLLKPSEFIILLLIIFFIVYFNSSEKTKAIKTLNIETKITHGLIGRIYLYLLTIWLGEASLLAAFLPFFLFVNGILYYIDYRILELTFTVASWKTAHLMLFFPSIWWLVSVWRCSIHANKLWRVIARTITLFLPLEFILRFIIATYYPNTFFDCQLLIVHYGDCF